MMFEVSFAQGCNLYDTSGKAYLDLISGIGVSNVGHRNAYVQEKVAQQMDKYWHTMVFGEHIQDVQVRLAQALSAELPWSQPSVFFVNSGSEAMEGAMKLAKRATGRFEFVAANHSYHGSTHGAMSLLSDTTYTNNFRPLLPGIHHINFNSIADLACINSQTAAVVIESVQGESGYLPANPDFLIALETQCRKHGVLIIMDEVQTAFGRTGSFMGWQTSGIRPDIILMAKGMGGGFPLGAFCADVSLMKTLSFNPVLGHITTFGGHPVSCAASLAALEFIRNEKLCEQIPIKESKFRSLLKLPESYKLTGKGLMMAIHTPSAAHVQSIIHHLRTHGVLTDWFLFNDKAIRLSPPLIISDQEIEFACASLNEAITSLQYQT